MRRFSQEQKDAAAHSQRRAEYAAAATTPIGYGVTFVPVAAPFLVGAAAVVGFALTRRAIQQSRIVHDPPDPDFREPIRVPEPQLDLSRFGEDPFQARAAAFAQANEKAESLCGAMVSSLERAMGAEQAGEADYADARAQEANQLAQQLAEAFDLSLELNVPLREAVLELELAELPAQEEPFQLGDILPPEVIAELDRIGVPRAYLLGDFGLIEDVSDPIGGFVEALASLEEGDRHYLETLRRQLDEGSLFTQEDEEMPGPGTPAPAG